MRGAIKTSTSPLVSLQNRIDALESILQNKSHQVLNGKDKEHALNQALYRLTAEYGKMEREYNKMRVINDQYKAKITDSLTLIQRLTAENDELRQLLKEARKNAASNELFMKRTGEQEFAQLEELRRKKLLRGATDLNNYENSNFISRQEAAAARWQRKREILQERERNRMMSVLVAMHLVNGAPTKTEQIKLISKKQEEKPPVKVEEIQHRTINNVNERRATETKAQSPPDSAKISYEDATKNSTKGKLSKKLQMGLIAEPIKIPK